MFVNLYWSLIYFIIILARKGQPLQCWSCSSLFETGCDDPFKPNDLTAGAQFFLIDCNHNYIMNGSLEEQQLMEHVFGPDAKMYCRKTVRKIYGQLLVHRGCSFGDTSKGCTDAPASEDCDSIACFEDGCNAAPSVTYIYSVFTPIIILLFSY